MFPSIRECTINCSTQNAKSQNRKIAIYHRARRSKFLSVLLSSLHVQFINIDESLNQKHLPSPHKRYITMDIDDANNGDSNESSSAASSSSSCSSSSSSSSSLSSLRHHSSERINRKRKSVRSASHRNSIKSRRVYTYTAAQMK